MLTGVILVKHRNRNLGARRKAFTKVAEENKRKQRVSPVGSFLSLLVSPTEVMDTHIILLNGSVELCTFSYRYVMTILQCRPTS